ncbi:hypothetical protein X474_24085 [Dethiosulfatarculus sandiegensis]|uniref:Uncharacterized protein n=1 Tax=Dethiosulfatarculus sandiegensis TaxID=1429043 RepID=A0A0D2JQ02_9BACT|nr:hypothetical protein X474_24085 [Dethiosulfatarculus sandiegensis]
MPGPSVKRRRANKSLSLLGQGRIFTWDGFFYPPPGNVSNAYNPRKVIYDVNGCILQAF